MIKINEIEKSFDSHRVLQGVSMQIEHGQNMIILGKSGTGKSVLLKLIIGLLKPDKGKIEVMGKEITSINRETLNELRKKMGFLFQDGALFDSMTLKENVAFPLRRHTKLKEKEIIDKVMDKLEQVELADFAKKMPGELSGGMRKRAGLARAMALDPEIMLYDEPTAGLDPITAREIDDLIVRLKEKAGVTSITVTHELVSALNVGDQFAVLNEGRVIEKGSYEELKQSKNDFVRGFISAAFARIEHKS